MRLFVIIILILLCNILDFDVKVGFT